MIPANQKAPGFAHERRLRTLISVVPAAAGDPESRRPLDGGPESAVGWKLPSVTVDNSVLIDSLYRVGMKTTVVAILILALIDLGLFSGAYSHALFKETTSAVRSVAVFAEEHTRLQ